MNKCIYFGQTMLEVINVNKDSKKSFFKERTFLALSLVSVLALAGVVTVASVLNYKHKAPYVSLDETDSSSFSENQEQAGQEGTSPNERESNILENETSSGTLLENETDTKPAGIDESTPDSQVAVDVQPFRLMFSEDDTLLWPVEGRIVLEFSMDGSIFFPTLEQYKYNPAMLIQSEAGTPVLAAADCVVKEIGTNEEIGTYVVMSLGSDYQLTYGQLKSLKVSEGDSVKTGDVIGVVNEPTKYYVVEGCNLYVKLVKGDTPVDPLDYLK